MTNPTLHDAAHNADLDGVEATLAGVIGIGVLPEEGWDSCEVWYGE